MTISFHYVRPLTLILASFVGCHASQQPENSEGMGGSTGIVEDSSSSIATGGTTGIGGANDTGATWPSGGTVGTDTSSTLPQCSTSDAPTTIDRPARRTIPWVFANGTASGGTGGTSGSTATCVLDSNHLPTCEGMATVQGTSEAPILAFSDGSTLTWPPALSFAHVAPPKVTGLSTVWVHYQATKTTYFMAGSYFSIELTIRNGSGGKTLWLGREGQQLSALDSSTVDALFAAKVRSEAVCSLVVTQTCSDVQRTSYDHILETVPEQRIGHASVTRVTTPQGDYEVLWTHSTMISLPGVRCSDGTTAATDEGFAASLL